MKEIIKEILEIYRDENIKEFLNSDETKEFARFVITIIIQAAIAYIFKK